MTDPNMNIPAGTEGPAAALPEADFSGRAGSSQPSGQAVQEFMDAMEGKPSPASGGMPLAGDGAQALPEEFGSRELPAWNEGGGSVMTQRSQEERQSMMNGVLRQGEFSGAGQENSARMPSETGRQSAMNELFRQPGADGSSRAGQEQRSGMPKAGAEEALLKNSRADQPAVLSVSDMFSAMTSPLESILTGQAKPAENAQAALADTDSLESMVERILVAAPDGGGKEVRLTLNSRVLKDAEVIIRRDVAGALSVTLQSGDSSVFQTLVSSQGELKRMLETQEKGEVRVNVSQGAEGEGNDANRRSRGRMDYDANE